MSETMPVNTVKRKNKTRLALFISSILLVYPLPQMAIDIYLPSWPAMANNIHTSNELLQLSLTTYVLFLGIAQLIYGPISDRFGRRPTLLIGISLFFISSFCCIFAYSINQLLIFRAIQGLGIGCGFTVASAVLADVFEGDQLARVTSYSAMVYSLSLIIAPILGGYLQHYIGWRANFAAMAIYAAALFMLIYFFVAETKTNTKIVTLSYKTIIKNYLFLFTNLKFIGAVLCLTLAYGAIIAFNILGPFLMQDNLGISVVHYGQLLSLVGLSYFLGATCNSKMVKHVGTHPLTIFGLAIMIGSSIYLLTASFMNLLSIINVMTFVCLTIFSLGFIYPNCFACALNIFEEKGYASALIGSVILVGVSVISLILSNQNSNNKFCLSFTFFTLAMLSILSYILTRLTKSK